MRANRPRTKHPTLLVLEKKLEFPMLLLSFAWLIVLTTELIYEKNALLYGLGTGIWILFIAFLTIRLTTAPNRLTFIKKNWLFVLALLVSILRLFPFLQSIPLVRILTATFGIQVLWIFASADHGMRSLHRKMGHRGVGYALTFTFVVIFTGAAGMLHFERISEDPQSIRTYSKALWWTAMQMTNIGSSYSIRTPGASAICLGISVYAAAMFGYLTALLATIFIGQKAKDPKSEITGEKSIQEVREEIIQLRHLIEGRLSSLSPERKLEENTHHDRFDKKISNL